MYLTTWAVSLHWSNVTKHPLPVHEERTREIRDSDDQAKKFIRFIRLTKEPVIPKYYSFSDDEGTNSANIVAIHPRIKFNSRLSDIPEQDRREITSVLG